MMGGRFPRFPAGSLRRRGLLIALVAVILAAWLVQRLEFFRRAPAPLGPWRSCERVIDGDTILLDRHERVRLIGVDTPETVHPSKPVEYFGKEASAFTRSMIEGRRVRLEYDWQRQDRYGRTLAYVFLEDGRLLNAEIIRQGYGHAYTRFPFHRMEEFRGLEREARENGRGLWAPAANP